MVILVLDAQLNIIDQDATLAGHVLESGRALVVAINKWDGLDQDKRDKIKDDLERKLPFLDFAEKHFISALHGSGVGKMFPVVDKVYANAMRDISTSELNRILEWALQEHQPPLARGRRISCAMPTRVDKTPPLLLFMAIRPMPCPTPTNVSS